MKKRVMICLTGIIVAIFTIIIANNNKQTFTEEGVMFAVNVNGVTQNSFPSKGMYKVDVDCSGAEGKWDYENWKLDINSIEENISCDVSFNTISKTYLNNKITSLVGTTQGKGQIVNENGYRYEGKNPNNYIWFNNESWRIIGVFDSSSHGQSGKNLVKIIRDESIGMVVWDKSGTNNWSTSSLKALLNGAYYNKQNGTDSGYCYGSSATIPTKCDYSNIGIDSSYRGMIVNATWYLGGYTTGNVTSDAIYGYERDSASKYSDNPASTTGYIGLMYASDYGYAPLASSCNRETNILSYTNEGCASGSWLYGNGWAWTITPASDDEKSIFNIHAIGWVWEMLSSTSGFAVTPTLYLDSSVYVIDGDGSMTNPYIIGM